MTDLPPDIYAHAKLNLFLHITGKREDGYHLLDSLTVFTNLADRISFFPQENEAPACLLKGPFAPALEHLHPSDNLALRAAMIFAGVCNKPFSYDIHIEKNIPPGAGLGGGSANAAGIVRALIDFLQIDMQQEELDQILISLGADVPACFKQQHAFMEGIGDHLTPAPDLPDLSFVIVYPGIPCDTAEVYKALDQSAWSGPAEKAHFEQGDFISVLQNTKNDLTEAAISLCPEIQIVLKAIEEQQGLQIARMSGSGSACFGLFGKYEEATSAAEILSFDHPDWRCMPARLKSPKN